MSRDGEGGDERSVEVAIVVCIGSTRGECRQILERGAAGQRRTSLVRDELGRFAKPLWQRRALRVFLDGASLSADPALWPSIRSALDRSRYLILFACPESAQSPWVEREVRYWLETRGSSNLLLVLTGGQLTWSHDSFHPEESTAIPEVLQQAFQNVPRWVDLTWARAQTPVRSDPRSREAVADLASRIHGIAKDELFGEDMRRHRRFVRLTRATIAVLTALTVAAASLAIVARTQRDEARHQARVALASELAAESGIAPYDRALLLAAASTQLVDSPSNRSALVRALEREPELLRFVEIGEEPLSIGLAPDGDSVAVSSQTELTLWSTDTGERQAEASLPPGSWSSLAFSANGRFMILGSDDGDLGIRRRDDLNLIGTVSLTGAGGFDGVGVSDGGRYAAFIAEGHVVSFEVGAQSAVFDVTLDVIAGSLSVSNDGSLRVSGAFSADRAATVDINSAGVSKELGHQDYAMLDSAFCADGMTLGSTNYDGSLAVINLLDEEPLVTVRPGANIPGGMALAPDCSSVAISINGAVHVYSVPDGVEQHVLDPGERSADLLSYSSDGRRLVARTPTGFVSWDLTLRRRLGTTVADIEPGGFAPRVSRGAGMTATADLSLAVIADPAAFVTRVIEPGTARERATIPMVGSGVAISGDRSMVAVDTQTWTIDGEPVRQLGPLDVSPQVAASGFVTDNALLAFVPGEDLVHLTAILVQGADQRSRPVRTPDGLVSAAYVTDDGRTFYVAMADGDVWRGEITGGDLLAPSYTLLGHVESDPSDLVVSDDGGRAAVQYVDHTVVFDLSSGKVLQTTTSPPAAVIGLDAAGRLLGVGTTSGTVVITDLDSGVRVAELSASDPGHDEDELSGLAFSADGRTLLTQSGGGQVIRWDFDPERLLRGACDVAGRDLSDLERRQYLGAAAGEPVCG